MKKCNTPNCGLKSLDCFSKNRNYNDGLCPKCKDCVRQSKKNHYARNKDRILAKTAEWQRKNKEKVSIRNKKWRDANKKKMSALTTNWAMKNPDRTRQNKQEWNKKNPDYLTQWKKQNTGSVNAYCAVRRALKKQAMPKWVNKKEIKAIYENCPDGYHVDHIIPLNHPLVCGLHVPWNLQYLTIEENLKKSNKIKELQNVD